MMNNSKTINTKQWYSLVLCLLAYGLAGVISTVMSAYLPNIVKELSQEEISTDNLGSIGSYLSSVFLFGWMTGGIIFGIISDKIGRKPNLIIATFLSGLFTILSGHIHDLELLLIFRFITGMGVGGVLLISTIYIAEIWEDKTKPIILGILAVFFPIGIICSGALTMWFADWRDAFNIGIFSVLVSLLMTTIPEVSVWNKFDKIKEVNLLPNKYKSNLLFGIIIFGSVLIGLWAIFSWIPTWIQSILPLGQNGQNERGTVMMLLGFGGILGGSISGILVKYLDTRITLLLTFMGCFLSSCVLFLTNKNFSEIIYFEVALLSFFLGLSQGSLSSYIPSLFPTSIRATATGLCFNIGRFFTASAVFFIGNLVVFLGGFHIALMIFSLFFIIAFGAVFLNEDQTFPQKNTPSAN